MLEKGLATTKRNKQHLILQQKRVNKKRRVKLLKMIMKIKTKTLLMMVINMTQKIQNKFQTKKGYW